ncbi:O-antigen ligase family protein [Prochlorococcus marinus]|uniref:Ligase n=1 Tax=Prochlorococcus marinus XMU1408 TaxID=2213228 RepID=A0A318R003_PROMR|nr:O-antigen ligase family protein [Prochlorococcus marinus]MBW3042961.1 ligase [Prochlorococcus marinus str. XMU1408]PYE00313.1 ligase [Prochlorococcus marinus XMU1408]
MINNANFSTLKNNLLVNNGWRCFQIGVFFLPSSALISYIFLLIALFEGSFIRRDLYWRDYWNYPLVLTSLLMLVGCIRSQTGWLAWIGLFNWLPFFWCFWGFQPYLLTTERRRKCASWLVLGSLPVLITGFGQLWLGWKGPWELFDGLIIWFISPGGEPLGRLSGLFDYANITAAWLSGVWPFCFASVIRPFIFGRNRVIPFLLSVAFVLAMILTNSRNAWGAIFIGLPLVVGSASWSWLIPLMVICFIPIVIAVLPVFDAGLQQFARSIVPESIWMRLTDIQFVDTRPFEATRIGQWRIAFNLIFEKPLFGWGAAAFSIIYPLRTGLYHGHSHNLPLEIAISHGILVAILLNLFVFALLIISAYYKIFNKLRTQKNLIIDRAWWTSALILICFHATDIPMFDSRVNILGWLILIGLRCIIFNPDTDKIVFKEN